MEEYNEAVEELIEDMKYKIIEMFNDYPITWVEEAYKRARKEAYEKLEEYRKTHFPEMNDTV